MVFDERLDLVRLMIEKVIVNEERQVRVYFKPPFDYLEETIRGVFKKHPEPRKIVIIGPKDSTASSRGNAVRLMTRGGKQIMPHTGSRKPSRGNIFRSFRA